MTGLVNAFQGALALGLLISISMPGDVDALNLGKCNIGCSPTGELCECPAECWHCLAGKAKVALAEKQSQGKGQKLKKFAKIMRSAYETGQCAACKFKTGSTCSPKVTSAALSCGITRMRYMLEGKKEWKKPVPIETYLANPSAYKMLAGTCLLYGKKCELEKIGTDAEKNAVHAEDMAKKANDSYVHAIASAAHANESAAVAKRVVKKVRTIVASVIKQKKKDRKKSKDKKGKKDSKKKSKKKDKKGSKKKSNKKAPKKKAPKKKAPKKKAPKKKAPKKKAPKKKAPKKKRKGRRLLSLREDRAAEMRSQLVSVDRQIRGHGPVEVYDEDLAEELQSVEELAAFECW